ncbi:MAG: HEAT repeat domain-containing protein [Planctomycetota bacterium]|nr:MAG: HEAT repeat domain-containing protein [Planctomycetota bacterium]
MEERGWIVRGKEVTNIAPPSDPAVDYLSGTTAHGDWPVRAIALYILGDLPQLGGRPELRTRITPVLTARLMDGHPTVRASATWSLGKLLRETPERPADVITAIASRLKDSDPFVRYAAAHSLASLNSTTPEAIPILKENLAHKSWWVVAGAAASLMRVGAEAGVAVPDLLTLLHHSNGTVRRNSYAALEAIRPEALKGSPDAENVRKEIEALVPSIKSVPPEK